MTNKKNVRIAKQLVRLAKSLVAGGEEQWISPEGNSSSTGPDDVKFHACVFRKERHDARDCDLTPIRNGARTYFGNSDDDECYGFFRWIRTGGDIPGWEDDEEAFEECPALDLKLIWEIDRLFKKLYRDCERLVGSQQPPLRRPDITPLKYDNDWFVVRIRDAKNRNALVSQLEQLGHRFLSDVSALGVRISLI